MLVPITRSKLLLVEGKDEIEFFEALLDSIGVDDVETRSVGGITKFKRNVRALKTVSGFHRVKSIGIVRDADCDPAIAFQSIQNSLIAAGLPVPQTPYCSTPGPPKVNVAVLPAADRNGMLEDLCLQTVEQDPSMACVKAFFRCLRRQLNPSDYPRIEAKARVRAFLASRELLEDDCYTCIQDQTGSCDRSLVPEGSVMMVHAFLSSRYKPDLDLGMAAKAGYWNLQDPSIAGIRTFLTQL